MPYVGPRSAAIERRGRRRRERKRESARGSSEKAERRSPRLVREKDRNGEGSSTGTKGAAMKQTNTERAGRPWLSRRASQSGGKKAEEGDGKKSERAKVRGCRHFKRPAHAFSFPPLFCSPPRETLGEVDQGWEWAERREGEEGGHVRLLRIPIIVHFCKFLPVFAWRYRKVR